MRLSLVQSLGAGHLYDDPELARVSHSFCLSLREGEGAVVRPCFSFEILTEITDDLQQRFERHMVGRLRSLNADFREALLEYEEAVTPLIELLPLGCGPFSSDVAKIKQTRMVRTQGV